jgi:hypothetical protein
MLTLPRPLVLALRGSLGYPDYQHMHDWPRNIINTSSLPDSLLVSLIKPMQNAQVKESGDLRGSRTDGKN